MPVTIEQARTAKDVAKRLISEHATITSIGITKNGEDFVISVGVARLPDSSVTLPSSVDGIAVICEETGDILAFTN